MLCKSIYGLCVSTDLFLTCLTHQVMKLLNSFLSQMLKKNRSLKRKVIRNLLTHNFLCTKIQNCRFRSCSEKMYISMTKLILRR
jgi:hypothetical protein